MKVFKDKVAFPQKPVNKPTKGKKVAMTSKHVGIAKPKKNKINA